jgi:hypothetical protein
MAEQDAQPATTETGEDTTVAELKALIQIPGALKIITNEVQPELRQDRQDPRSAPADDVDLRDPQAFVCHNVVELEGPDDRGRYRARSAEGDWTVGYPEQLLSRLRQWRGGD